MDALYLLSGAGMMVVALATVAGWKARSKIPWVFSLWGALAWIVGVTLKAVAAILTKPIITGIRDVLPRYFSEPLLWIYVGLLTGIFECGVTLGFAFIRKIRTARWKEAVGFGLGFGAIEAFWLGLNVFVLVLLIILVPDKLPPKLFQLVISKEKYSFLVIPAPVIERITAILIHAFSGLLIIYAVQFKAWRWFWVSFFYKSTVDAIAGFIHLTYGVENLTTLGIWVVQLSFLPFGVVGIWGLWVFRHKWQNAV